MAATSEWRACLAAADRLVSTSKWRNEPVWIRQASAELVRLHPHSGIDMAGVSKILRAIVIEQRWSLADSRVDDHA